MCVYLWIYAGNRGPAPVHTKQEYPNKKKVFFYTNLNFIRVFQPKKKRSQVTTTDQASDITYIKMCSNNFSVSTLVFWPVSPTITKIKLFLLAPETHTQNIKMDYFHWHELRHSLVALVNILRWIWYFLFLATS